MRILYLQPAELFGGAERQGVLAIKYIQEINSELEVVPVVGPGKEIGQALDEAGVHDYLFCPYIPAEPRRLSSFFRRGQELASTFISWGRACHEIKQIASHRKIDLIYASRTTGWTIAGEVGRLLGLPVVWRAGSRTTTETQQHALKLLDHVYPPDGIISNSKVVNDSIATLLRCPATVIPNGVDINRFDPYRSRPRFREQFHLEGRPVVGLAARPHPDKGFDSLSLLILQLTRELPQLQVLIAGDSLWRSHYEQLICYQQGLKQRVIFLGHVQKMESFYRSCDVLLLPSRERSIEGLPNAILEGMAMQCPIVASKVGGIVEAVHNGVEGILVEPDDWSGMAASIIQIIKNPLLAKNLGFAGRRRVRDEFSVSRVMTQVINFLNQAGEAYLRKRRLALRRPQLSMRTLSPLSHHVRGVA